MDALAAGKNNSGLSPAEKAMVTYATKLTVTPKSMTEEDVQELRNTGFGDRAILEINLVVAYMNFVNRIADGLGVELESSLQKFTR